jgi:hypothetical protein
MRRSSPQESAETSRLPAANTAAQIATLMLKRPKILLISFPPAMITLGMNNVSEAIRQDRRSDRSVALFDRYEARHEFGTTTSQGVAES